LGTKHGQFPNTIFVYAQEPVPGRIGTVFGFFFGFAFGLSGIGSALLGKLTDITSINIVYHACAFLLGGGHPEAFLPNLNPPKTAATR
jgi:FSR family fosmidomycin resistance protein-like MFS transporter